MAYSNPQPPHSFSGCIFGLAMIAVLALCGLVALVVSVPQ
jgi:hypothetical protein